MTTTEQMNHAADNIRILTAAMVEKAQSGHPGGAMGGADFINVLYSEFLRYDLGKAATVSFLTRGTWHQCYMPHCAWQANTPSQIYRTCANGKA